MPWFLCTKNDQEREQGCVAEIMPARNTLPALDSLRMFVLLRFFPRQNVFVRVCAEMHTWLQA